MHFYELKNGKVEPRHFIEMSTRPGELRPTRIADARKHGWVPSVTTVAGLLDKPALTDWKIQEHLKIAYAFPPNESCPESLEEWISDTKRRTQDALEKAPKDGTDFHDVMENAYSAGAIENERHREIAQTVMSEVEANTGVTSEMFTPEASFVHPMGFAGKVDLRSLSWCIDWKTKNTADKWKPGKMAYPEMAMQLSAYRVGLNLPDARCANVFICLEDGSVEFHEWDSTELDKQWANFADLLRIWLRNAGYVPGSTPPSEGTK